MDSVNVPILAESRIIYSTSTHYNNDSNSQAHRHSLQQNQQLPDEYKNQILDTGTSKMLPFVNFTQKDTETNQNSKSPVANFSSLQAIDGSQLDGAISLTGICERIFVSPNAHNNSNSNHQIHAKNSSVLSGGGGPVILESVTMPSFADILFNNQNKNQRVASTEMLTTSDPVIPQKSNCVEYYQLKPLDNRVEASVVSTSSYPSSATEQLLDFEVVPSTSQRNVVTTTFTEPASTTSTEKRMLMHSIEELSASSSDAATIKKTISTKEHQQIITRQPATNFSGANTGEESSSDDEIGLKIDDKEGYQETNSSHSQQSASGAGNGAAGNSSTQLLNSGSNSSGNGYILLPPGAGGSSGAAGAHIPSNAGGNAVAGVAGTAAGQHGGTSASSGGEAIDFKHLFEELCPVCGDKVSGYHYGLLTCESCKGFFKRTVQNKKVYTCVAERSCHIDKTQRKRCPYCRFQKCLEVGMKLEAVRADRMRGGRNKFGPMYKRDRARKLQVMRQRQLALQALRSSMGTDVKPTPLSPSYQQAYPNMNIKQEIQIPQVSSLTQSPDSSPSPIAIALGQVNANVIATTISTGSLSGNGNSSSLLGNVNSNPNNVSNGSGSVSGGVGGEENTNLGSSGGNNNAADGLQRSGNTTNSNSSSSHDIATGSLQNSGESKLCFDSGTHPSSTADSLIEPLRVSPMIREFVQSIDDREWQTQLFALLQKQTYNQVEVDLFELMCKVLDQNLFSQVDWARNTVFFKDLKVDDQMKLLQHSWSDMLVLDHLHHRIHNGLPDETQLNNGQVFNLMSLGLLGVPQLGDYFNELQNKLQELKFDMGDYVCMKFLILLNPDVRGIVNKKTVLEGHENVQAALLDYTLTCYPSVNDKFRRLLNILPEIHAMAARGEEHLYSKHCAGSAPTQTLLMEMLHAKRKV